MARAKPKPKPKPKLKATRVSSSAEFPYPHIGQGVSRCSDDFSIWVLFADACNEAEQAAIASSIPEALREQARSKDGELTWLGPLLHINSGMDFKYFVASYDENHLAWVENKLSTGAQLTTDDLDRVTREVMNPDLSGPRDPSRTVWNAFDADLEVWLARIATTGRIRLVVKNVAVRDAEVTAWHRWSAENALARLEDLPSLLRGLPVRDEHSAAYLFVHPLLDATLRARPAKELGPAERDLCIALLGLEGLVIEPGLLAQLVTTYPAKERAAVVQRLLATHHGSVMGLFVAGPTKQLLLDDAVYASAIEHAPHCKVPFYRWLEQRRGIEALLKKQDDATRRWGLRVLDLIEANGELAREVGEEEASGSPSVIYRSTQRALHALRARLAG